jgi:hypothetical protein
LALGQRCIQIKEYKIPTWLRLVAFWVKIQLRFEGGIFCVRPLRSLVRRGFYFERFNSEDGIGLSTLGGL